MKERGGGGECSDSSVPVGAQTRSVLDLGADRPLQASPDLAVRERRSKPARFTSEFSVDRLTPRERAVPGFLPFFPTPSPLTCAIFRVAFAPKQHGNACFAG